MECKGTEWNEMQWNREWNVICNLMEWNGTQWNGMEYGMERNGTEWNEI